MTRIGLILFFLMNGSSSEPESKPNQCVSSSPNRCMHSTPKQHLSSLLQVSYKNQKQKSIFFPLSFSLLHSCPLSIIHQRDTTILVSPLKLEELYTGLTIIPSSLGFGEKGAEALYVKKYPFGVGGPYEHGCSNTRHRTVAPKVQRKKQSKQGIGIYKEEKLAEASIFWATNEMGTVLDSHFLAITALVTVGYQFLFFVITALLKFDKVTDFAGSTNFVIIAVLTLVLKASWQMRQVVMTLLVVIWGLRLGLFLLMRIMQWGEDRRFDEMRSNLGKLAVFWILQAVWVWSVSLPVTVVNATDRDPSIGAADVIGWLMWAVGLTVEATADQQKLVFKNYPESRGKWCNVGIWKFSRHPNYFGELLLWWGLFVASTSILEGAEWLVIFGPIFLTLLLLFVSGIPLLEASADKKFGSSMEYRHYKRTTSPLIPLPSALYGKLPAWFKTAFLLELPLYSLNLPQGEPLNWYRTDRDKGSKTS